MAALYYDLHIHSCLSPCGSEDMTPYNIAAMAALKGLDVIAVTDHNSCKNCPAVLAAAKEYGVLALPGMELTTSEEVHAVCLFETLDAAMAFDDMFTSGCFLLKIRKRSLAVRKSMIWKTMCRERKSFCSSVPPPSPLMDCGSWWIPSAE